MNDAGIIWTVPGIAAFIGITERTVWRRIQRGDRLGAIIHTDPDSNRKYAFRRDLEAFFAKEPRRAKRRRTRGAAS